MADLQHHHFPEDAAKSLTRTTLKHCSSINYIGDDRGQHQTIIAVTSAFHILMTCVLFINFEDYHGLNKDKFAMKSYVCLSNGLTTEYNLFTLFWYHYKTTTQIFFLLVECV